MHHDVSFERYISKPRSKLMISKKEEHLEHSHTNPDGTKQIDSTCSYWIIMAKYRHLNRAFPSQVTTLPNYDQFDAFNKLRRKLDIKLNAHRVQSLVKIVRSRNQEEARLKINIRRVRP